MTNKFCQIYFEIKEQINGQDVLGYLKDLYSFYEYYARFLDPTLEPNENIRKYLDRLHRLDVTIIYPFLLNCYDDYQQAQITEHDFIAVMKILENFILRRFVCNIQTRGLNRIFVLLYSQVSKDTNLASESFVNRLKLTLQTRNYPKDPEFQSQLMAVNLYTGNRSQKARLILEAIEEFFKHKEKVVFDNLSIEHIMPQTLNKWWQEHLGTDYNATHQSLVHSLGNLTLTGYNSELSNDDFLSKRTRFVKSHLELNKYFGSQESWRQENIEARGKYLAEIALQIWGYFGDESAPSPQLINSMKGKTPKLLTILGEEFTVKSWRDVLEMTLNKIAEIDPEGFDNILAQFPRFIGWDKKDFRNTRQLKNGAFMEVNLSANDIYILCLKLIETTKLSREDWHIEAILK